MTEVVTHGSDNDNDNDNSSGGVGSVLRVIQIIVPGPETPPEVVAEQPPAPAPASVEEVPQLLPAPSPVEEVLPVLAAPPPAPPAVGLGPIAQVPFQVPVRYPRTGDGSSLLRPTDDWRLYVPSEPPLEVVHAEAGLPAVVEPSAHRAARDRMGWPGQLPLADEGSRRFALLLVLGLLAAILMRTGLYIRARGKGSEGPAGGPHDAGTGLETRAAPRGLRPGGMVLLAAVICGVLWVRQLSRRHGAAQDEGATFSR